MTSSSEWKHHGQLKVHIFQIVPACSSLFGFCQPAKLPTNWISRNSVEGDRIKICVLVFSIGPWETGNNAYEKFSRQTV